MLRMLRGSEEYRPGAVRGQAHGAAHEAAGGRGAEAAIHRPRPGLRPQLTRALLAAAQWRLETQLSPEPRYLAILGPSSVATKHPV